MVDPRGISEFYSELLAYSSAILGKAVNNGDTYERFKLSIKFAFSIMHALSLQDVVHKRPIIPIVGETFEGHYIMGTKIMNVFAESDYCEYEYTDLVTQKPVKIKKEQETTYFLVEPPTKAYSYKVHGHLTYANSWRGNNLITHLNGNLYVQFYSPDEEED